MAASVMAGSGTPSAPPASRIDQAWTEVEALVGTPRCRVDADCRVVGVGSRACGGPERFLAWSTRVSPPERLQGAVARHAALRQAADAKAGVASTCQVLPEPGVHCARAEGQDWGVCRLSPEAPGPGGHSRLR